jgi:hypothetical protein
MSLGELIDRHGDDAIITARPWMLDTGESYRWEVEIDGVVAPNVRADIRTDAERPGVKVMLLVLDDGDRVELARWTTQVQPYGPAAVVRRLGDLR